MEKKQTQNFKVFNFNSSYVGVDYTYNAKDGFITWGKNNDYPNYILDLYNYNGSAVNKAIINKKSKLSVGYGIKEILNPTFKEYLKDIKFNDILRKIDLDFEIFNGFALEIIWSRDGSQFTLKHIPVQSVRIGIENDKIKEEHYWLSSDWTKYKKDGHRPEFITKYNPEKRAGRQLLFYMAYNPDYTNPYPIPYYTQAIDMIELEKAINVFHLNNAKKGFSGSYIINFATGIPTIEEMEENYREFMNNFTGEYNSGSVILTYSEGSDGAPTFTPITLNDSDERFLMLKDSILENIVMANEIPPQLVILTPGKMGSTDERKELLAEFQSYYITPRQTELEVVFNEELFNQLTFSEPIILNEYSDVEKPITQTQIIN